MSAPDRGHGEGDSAYKDSAAGATVITGARDGLVQQLVQGRPEAVRPRSAHARRVRAGPQAFAAEVKRALGKTASVTAVDGADGVTQFLTQHGQTGRAPAFELVFAHLIPVTGGGLAPQAKADYWMQNWVPGRAFPAGDTGRPSVQVNRLTGTNCVFIRTKWATGVAADVLLNIARHQEKWYAEIAAHWLTH